MSETRNIRLLRTAIGIIVGFLLMWAAVAVAYQGLAWFQAGQRILGIVVLVAVGPLLEIFTHVTGIKTRGLGRGIIMGMFAGMMGGGRFVAQNDGPLWAAVSIPLYIFFSALFIAWVRERFSSGAES
jgi:hypothetical protein